MKITVVFISTILALSECETRNKESLVEKHTHPDTVRTSMDQKKIDLLTTVLNSPQVLENSKLELIRAKYTSIYIVLKKGEFENTISTLTQAGRPLVVLYGFSAVEQNSAYYRVSMDIKQNRAHVNVLFDVTGLYATGHFNYINDRWMPDQDFSVGVR